MGDNSIEVASQFFHLLYPHDAPGWLTIWTLSDKRTEWFRPASLRAAARYAVGCQQTDDVYFGLGLRRERLDHGRGDKDDVYALPGICIDMDIKHPVHKATNLPPTVEDARKLLEKFPLPLTTSIFSGHGFYGYWLFRELWLLENQQEREAAEHLLAQLQATIRETARLYDWHVDSTFSLDHVFRVPGTFNLKDPNNPKLVTILHTSPECRYNPSDFEPYLIDIDTVPFTSNPQGGLPEDLPTIDVRELDISSSMKFVIVTGTHPDDPLRYPSRSEPEWAVMHALIDAGYDDPIIGSVLLNPSYRISSKPLEKGRRWLEQEIQRARKKVEHKKGEQARLKAERAEQKKASAAAEGTGREQPSAATLYSDQFNAERFVTWYGQDMRYCEDWNRWLVYDGKRWKIDNTGQIMRWAKETIKRLGNELADIKGEAEAKAFVAHIKKSLSIRSLEAMVKSAQSEPGIPVTPDAFDRDPMLFNAQNGTIDLRTGTLLPHQREDLLMKVSPVPYLEDATCPLWEKTIDEIYAGDEELIRFDHKVTGFTLTGDTRERIVLICHGSGSNGKSTKISVMREYMGEGEYALRTNIKAFMESTAHHQPASVEYYIAKLHNVRFAYASEGEEGARLSESLIKDVTGGVDYITGRHPYGQPFTFRPRFKLWFASNHAPVIRGTDPAIWQRTRKIPFNVTFEGREDKELFDKLCQELPGILRWAVKGCLLWQMHGLEPPKAVKDATAAYRRAMDVVGRFLEERCVLAEHAKVDSTTLYQTYLRWCTDTGEQPLTQHKLAERLKERGLRNDEHRSSTGRKMWSGVGVQSEPSE